jgi:hypothetical protein
VRKTIICAALCALLAIPAVAMAAKIRHSGNIVGDQDSKITLRVTKKGGEIKKISGFEAKGVLIRCQSGNSEFNFTITGSIPVNDKNGFKARLPNVNDPDEKLRVTGKVQKGGKVVVGNIKTNELTQQNGERCDVPKQRFKTEKV